MICANCGHRIVSPYGTPIHQVTYNVPKSKEFTLWEQKCSCGCMQPEVERK